MTRHLAAFVVALLLVVEASASDWKLLQVGRVPDKLNSTSTFVLDNAADQIEWIYQMKEDVTITTILLFVALRNGTPPTYKVSIQGVDTAGIPDGTIKGGGSPASETFTPPASTAWNDTIQRFTLDNSYAAVRGEIIAVVVAYDSGTIDGSNKSTFGTQNSGTESTLPYLIENNAGSRSRKTTLANIGFASATTTYGMPTEGYSNVQYSSGSSPDEYALRFTLDSAWGATFTIPCVYAAVRTPAAATSFKVTLYVDTNGNGTDILQDVIIDSDHLANNGSIDQVIRACFNETTLSTLTHGTEYWIGFAPQDAVSNLAIRTIDFDVAGDLSVMPGGTSWYLATKTCVSGSLPCPTNDTGTWTSTTTKRPAIWFEMKDWTEPAGGGGGAKRPIGGGL